MKNTRQKHFDILLLIARPAAGKSEIIAHLENTPLETRISSFHIGHIEVIDDFPMLWTWFEEDDILSNLGHPRLHTDNDYWFLYDYLWDVLIHRINRAYEKKIRDHPDLHKDTTVIIEFARGVSQGGFSNAIDQLSIEIIKRIAICYVDVSWEESLRKNIIRYNPDRPDSILEHGLPNDKIKKLYRNVDWHDLIKDNPEFLEIQGVSVPYISFENEDDVTSQGGEVLTHRLKRSLAELFQKYQEIQSQS